jgi:pyruvate formate lyase activating enzyme
MKQAYLYKKLNGGKIECRTCPHYCHINPGEKGICKVRINIEGQLFVSNYGKTVALNIDPIEKKPLFHFLPGTDTLSLAAAGCNFHCLNCQNWTISQFFKTKKIDIPERKLSPQEIVDLALRHNLPSISYTYTEPTVFLEYALEIMRLAQKANLKNIFVSNGFISSEAIDLVVPYLDAANIDIKSFSDKFYQNICGGKLEPVLNTTTRLKKEKIWLEITTLIIPTLNDSFEEIRSIAKFIKKRLGAETPWHISPFVSSISWKLKHFPNTPEKTLRLAGEIGRKVGLKNVYVGLFRQ